MTDIYQIIRESKEEKQLLTFEELDKLYTPEVIKTLFYIINKDEEKDYCKLAEYILKKREDYQIAKKNDNLKEFKKDIKSEFKRIFKTDKFKKKEDFFNYINNSAEAGNKNIVQVSNNPDKVIYKLFLNKYNSNTPFTWAMFKELKKDYEKNNQLEGENIYNLKSMIEKYTKIEHVDNNTVFDKSANTLSDKLLSKLDKKLKE